MDGIARYLEKNYSKPDLCLDRVSAMAKMDRYKFSKTFKKQFGYSFVSYLNMIRINQSVELFKDESSVKEIAFQVGYRSVEYFNRVFKKVNGVSPKEYQRKIVNITSENGMV